MEKYMLMIFIVFLIIILLRLTNHHSGLRDGESVTDGKYLYKRKGDYVYELEKLDKNQKKKGDNRLYTTHGRFRV